MSGRARGENVWLEVRTYTTDQGDPNINPIWPNLTQSISISSYDQLLCFFRTDFLIYLLDMTV